LRKIRWGTETPMPVFDADGTPIHVEAEGRDDAPPVIFSNSLGTTLSMWDQQAAALRDRFRVIRYDTRGHGRSGAPAGPYSMERLGRDALAVLNGLGIAKAHWCGLSMGGMTGMWLARHAPERIGRLVLANTAAKSANPDLWNARIRAVAAKGLEAIADTVLGVWFTKGFRDRNKDTVAHMRETMVGLDPQGYVACCSAIRDMDQRWGIATIKLPTLVIAGKHDMGTPVASAELIVSRIKGAKLVVLNAAHISNIEQPPAFTDAVEKFLRRR
jgi:3-oxoadipate enol-lactonase